MKAVKRVLFITPAASSAGGNVFLLRFLRWFKANTNIPFLILFAHSGDKKSEFDELTGTYYLNPEFDSRSLLRKAIRKAGDKLAFRKRKLRAQIKRENIGMIFSNTVINSDTLPMFSDFDVPVVSFCHELESVINLTGVEKFRRNCGITDHFLAVSYSVQNELIDKHGIPANKVSMQYGFIPLKNQATNIEEKKRDVRNELGLPEDAFIVGASGTLNWRKAPEEFIRIADSVAKKAPGLPIYFVWVGGALEGDHSLYCARYDVEKMGLSDRLVFLEHKSEPSHYFAAIDVFAMVSREDAFPLVCLESAELGKPIICFENAGGMPEFVGEERGFVVPYMDTEAFAEKILELFADPQMKEIMGTNAAAKMQKDHDIELEAPKIASVIQKTLDHGHSSIREQA